MREYDYSYDEGCDDDTFSGLDDNYHEEDIYEEHKDEPEIEESDDNYKCDSNNVTMARMMLLEKAKKRAKLSDDYQSKQYVDNFKIMG